MSFHYIIAFFLLFSLGVSAKSNKLKHKITWVKVNYPPLYMEPDIGEKGIHNKISDKIESELKDKYDFKSITANITRMHYFFTQNSKDNTYCTPGGAYHPTPTTAYAKDILFNVPSAGIVIKRGNPFFKNVTSIKMLDIVKTKKIKIGYVKNGHYHPSVSKIIKENSSSFFGIQNTEPMMTSKMVHSKRIDGFLIYPYVYAHQLNTLPHPFLRKLRFVEIEESGASSPVSIFCSNTTKGKELLAEFDQITKQASFKSFVKEVLEPYENYKNDMMKTNLGSIKNNGISMAY